MRPDCTAYATRTAFNLVNFSVNVLTKYPSLRIHPCQEQALLRVGYVGPHSLSLLCCSHL